MDIVLNWEGPVGAGLFPLDDPDALEALANPGVYLRVKSYEGARRVAYVGQSVNLIKRFDEHLRATLAFERTLRNSAGEPVLERGGPARLAAYNDLAKAAALSRDEALRTRFYYARCEEDLFPREHLNLVETLLVERLAQHVGGAAANLENRISPPAPDELPAIEVFSEFNALPDEGHGLLEELLGCDPMVVGEQALVDIGNG